jgi:hypothetical protein
MAFVYPRACVQRGVVAGVGFSSEMLQRREDDLSKLPRKWVKDSMIRRFFYGAVSL